MKRKIKGWAENVAIVLLGLAMIGGLMLCTVLYYGSIVAACTWVVKSLLGW